MPRPKYWYLQDLDLDQRLPHNVYEELIEEARVERWGHKADIHRAPDDQDISLVLEGRVALQEANPRDVISLAEGDLFGHAHDAETDSQLTLKALDDTTLAVIPRGEFRDRVTEHLGDLDTRVGLFTKRRDIWVPVEPLLFTTPRRRLAQILLHLVELEGEKNGREAQVPARLPPRKLSDLSGIERSRVRELLKFFREQQLLELGAGHTRIIDLDELRRIAGEK